MIKLLYSLIIKMVGRAFCVKIIFDLHAVTCPGVWLCPKGKVALKIHIFESCVATHRLTPIFPLLYHNKFTFKKVFTGVSTLAELEKKLCKENIFIEMIQWTPAADRNICLATFETNLLDLLYPAPCFKGLIAGVDVDLLMEPSKYFPGILSPKIEVSTKTTIEEVSDAHPAEVRVINPKTINSMNQQCIHKRKEPSPVRRVPQQKKVCHHKGKSDAYLCRLCRRQKNNVTLHNCNPSEENLPSSKNQCYHNVTEKRQICSHSSSSPKKSLDNYNSCNDSHILDSCPICLKYKCYFSNKRSDSNSLTKLNDVTNYQNLLKCSESKSSVSNKVHCKCNDTYENSRDSGTCKLCSDLNSLNLRNSTQKKRYQTHNENCNKYSDRCRSSSMHRSSSEPSLNDDETTSILLAKIKQLERTKERLNYSNCHDGDSYNTPSCDVHEHHSSEVRKGFYKNLQKFYKRMYKQAKHRANDC